MPEKTISFKDYVFSIPTVKQDIIVGFTAQWVAGMVLFLSGKKLFQKMIFFPSGNKKIENQKIVNLKRQKF